MTPITRRRWHWCCEIDTLESNKAILANIVQIHPRVQTDIFQRWLNPHKAGTKTSLLWPKRASVFHQRGCKRFPTTARGRGGSDHITDSLRPQQEHPRGLYDDSISGLWPQRSWFKPWQLLLWGAVAPVNSCPASPTGKSGCTCRGSSSLAAPLQVTG